MFITFVAKRITTAVVWQCFSVLFVNKNLPSKDVDISGWDQRADLVRQIINKWNYSPGSFTMFWTSFCFPSKSYLKVMLNDTGKMYSWKGTLDVTY